MTLLVVLRPLIFVWREFSLKSRSFEARREIVKRSFVFNCWNVNFPSDRVFVPVNFYARVAFHAPAP